jgi:hypothetical protein
VILFFWPMRASSANQTSIRSATPFSRAIRPGAPKSFFKILDRMGGEPQTALAIATVPSGLEAKIEADLMLMMGGANEVLRDAGCALVGGHTSEGAELSLGS